MLIGKRDCVCGLYGAALLAACPAAVSCGGSGPHEDRSFGTLRAERIELVQGGEVYGVLERNAEHGYAQIELTSGDGSVSAAIGVGDDGSASLLLSGIGGEVKFAAHHSSLGKITGITIFGEDGKVAWSSPTKPERPPG